MNKERYPYINNPFGFKLPERKPVIHPVINEWENFTEEDKTILSNIKKIITSYIGDYKITAYGSRLKGYWTEKSDYDIIVYFVPSIKIQNEIRTYNYDVKVDIQFAENPVERDIEIEIK